MSEKINYEQEVKKVYHDAYVAYNSLFETHCLYENHRMENRLSDRVQRAYEVWESAHEKLNENKKGL